MNAGTSSSDKVIVGCKLPNGLHLDLKTKEGDRVRITLNGTNAARIVGGYGLTHNVPTDFMSEWLKKNAKHAAVVNGSIFIHGDEASAVSIAKERQEIETKLEPIDPVKSGMLSNEHGQVDPKALRDYQAQQAKNPMRNMQQQE